MPYNTRRKSLSLPSLGIHLPNTSRRSPSVSKPHATDDQLPPSKKVKRSHDSVSQSPEPQVSTSSSKGAKEQLNGGRQISRRGTYEQTPPPSPTDGDVAHKIDTEGINDDIVVAVIEQLEKTGNRPHLVKELAAVLVTLNDNVANSANPAALLSSRLSAYLKRPWTALAPCPVAKELIPIHPRKVYYYLTTLPRQPLPENSDDVIIPAVNGKQITPSVSSVDQDEEDAYARERARLSPSPEVDLSSPDFDEDNVDLNGRAGPGCAARSGHSFADHRTHPRLMHSHRAVSPPLEGDEKEFTQTASAVRERASEERASRSDSKRDRPLSAISEGLSETQDGNMSISGSPMDETPLSSITGGRMADDQYGDYFLHVSSRDQVQDLDEAAAVALFGTSPSPSLTSVASSLSSGTSADSDAGLYSPSETNGGLLSLKQGMVGGALPENFHAAPVSTLKRSIDMLNSDLSDLDMQMSDLAEWDGKLSLRTRAVMSMDVDMVSDSWIELQSPETVEVDELDEMFGEI